MSRCLKSMFFVRRRYQTDENGERIQAKIAYLMCSLVCEDLDRSAINKFGIAAMCWN
jgi:hypothetical protein